MPLSKRQERERERAEREEVISKEQIPYSGGELMIRANPLIPKEDATHAKPRCNLPGCVICEPEVYQEEYRKAFGHYDPLGKVKKEEGIHRNR